LLVHCDTGGKIHFLSNFEISEAEVINQWFGRTVIFSDQRFAYEEAQYIIETKDDTHSETSITGSSYQVSAEIVAATLKLDELAKILRRKRMNDGALKRRTKNAQRH
jgi:ribonuclease R